MAAETQAPEPAAAEASKEEVVVTTTAAKEEQTTKARRGEDLKEVLAKDVAEEAKEDAAAAAVAEEQEEGKKDDAEPAVVPQSASFKEESNVVADLIEPHKKALEELKQLVAAALANHEFTKPPPPPPKEEEKKVEEPEKKADEAVKEEEKEKEKEKEKEGAAEEPEKEAKSATEEDEPKKEDAPPAAEEVPEKPAVEVDDKEVIKEAVVVEEPPAAVAEDKKPEPAVDEDGAKTVEAIEETVVPATNGASASASEEAAPPPTTVEKLAATEAEPAVASEEKKPPPEEVFLWGVPLLADERSDTILLKFLRARDYKPKDALSMMKDTVLWRKDFGADDLLSEELDVPGLDKAVFTSGFDKEGHPVCYNTYGVFQDKELYQSAFGDEEKRKRFLRWRVQFLEKGIREQLDFSPTGVCTMVQINDFKDAPWVQKKELRVATKQALYLLQDNYPEFVHKQIFINVPWWYLAFNRMISPFLTQRTKSKMVFAGPSKSADTLFKYIAPEQVPVQFGGLKKDDEADFDTSDAVTEVTIKPSSKHAVEIPVTETSSVLVWELRVIGWDVSYGAEFVPAAEGGYTVIVQKSRKLVPSDDPIEKNSFKIGEPGKIVLTVDNTSSKKKKLLYRSKVKGSSD